MCRVELCVFLISSAVPFRFCAVVNSRPPKDPGKLLGADQSFQIWKTILSLLLSAIGAGNGNLSLFPQSPVALDPLLFCSSVGWPTLFPPSSNP